MSELERYRWLGGTVGRRNVIRGGLLGGAGLTAAALIGCGSDDDDDGVTPTTSPGGGGGTQTPSEPDHVREQNALAEQEGSPFPYTYAEPDTQPKAGGTIRNGVTWEASVFDTNKSAGADAVGIANAVANRLVGMVTGPELNKYKIEFQPELAKSWDVAPDGLTYTFHLQEGVKFQNVAPLNGRAFTARDVVEAYERAAASTTNKPFLELMDSVSAPNDTTVRITMKQPDADFLIPLASKALPIYPSEIYDNGMIENNQVIGTGPAILGEVQKGSFIRVTSNPDYWEGKPHLDGMEWLTMKDTAARVAAFRAGQLEFAGTVASNKLEIDALLKSNPDIQVTADPIVAGVTMIGVNPNNPKFQDERIRQAMSLAIDREKLVQLIHQGDGKVLPEFGWPFLFDKTPTGAELGPYYAFNLEEAKKLMSAAGVSELSFDMISARSYSGATVEPVYAAFADFWRAIGVTLNVKDADFAAFNQAYYAKNMVNSGGDAIQGWSTQAPSANGYFYDAMHSKSPKNYFGINDAQIDEWATQQRSEVDPEVRKETQRKIWDRYLTILSRFTSSTNFSMTIFQPWLRYYRFNGPYIGIHSYYEWGMGYHKAWLDK